MFDDLNKSDYTEIYKVVTDFEELIDNINKNIENKDFIAVRELTNNGQEIYNRFYEWLTKTEL